MRKWNICGGLALLLVATQALAAGTKINGVVYGEGGTVVPPQSTKDLLPPDQALRLKKIFLFPSIDDLSGALSPKLDEKLADLFSKNTRFELIRDPQVVKALSPDESSYYKAAQNQMVHREAARVTGADTTVLLRTRNIGNNTQMHLEIRDARGNLLFQEEGSIPGSSTMDVRWAQIERMYRAVLSKLPFEGTITGRTANTLTIDLGMGSMKQGEEIEIARLVSVQRHPLLGTVVGTDYVRTGRAKVTTVDRVLSFAEVIEEVGGEKVSPGQKILLARGVIQRKVDGPEPEIVGDPRLPKKPKREEAKEENPLDDRLQGDFDKPRQRYGQVGGDLYYGSLGNSQVSGGATSEFTGSGLGGDLGGELWVTKNWIFSGAFGFHGATLEGPTGILGASSWRDISLLVGYRIFPESLAEGVTLTGNFGYEVMNFELPSSSTFTVGAKRYSGLMLKMDAEIAFLAQQKISVGFGIQPFSSLTELGPSLGTPNGGSAISLHLGWNRQLMEQIWLRIGMRYLVASGSYENSATVSNKRFAIGPGIYYLF